MECKRNTRDNFCYRGTFKDSRGRERGAEGIPTLGQTTPLFGVYNSRARAQREQKKIR